MFWSVLLWLALGLVLVVVLVLSMPVRLRLWARSDPEPRLAVQLGFLGGLVPWIAMYDSAKTAAPAEPAKADKSDKRKKRRPRRKGGRVPLRRMIEAGPELLRGLLRQFRIERCRIDGRFGLDDPAMTGQLYGLVAPFLFGSQWAWPRPGAVRLVPVFDRACLEGEADLAIAVVPIRLAGPGLRFAWAVFGPGR